MKTIILKRVLHIIAAGLLCVLTVPSFAEDSTSHKVVDGLVVYLGVIPAEMLLGHPKGHLERNMHGDIPDWGYQYHVIVALFDDASGKRVTGAEVKARVIRNSDKKFPLPGPQKKLEPMVIAGNISYGNYFNMPEPTSYRIQIQIRRAGAAETIETEFSYQHAVHVVSKAITPVTASVKVLQTRQLQTGERWDGA